MATYFDGIGKEYTEQTARLAVDRAKELAIAEFVVASNMGQTAWALIKELGGDGTGVTVVTHSAGFREPFTMEMMAEEQEKITATGATVVTATHVLGGVEIALRAKHKGTYPAIIMADTLRLFGQGMKVAVECALIAADAGTLGGDRIVSIGGSGRGADTAIVLTPGHSNALFDQVKIHEVICKPNLY